MNFDDSKAGYEALWQCYKLLQVQPFPQLLICNQLFAANADKNASKLHTAVEAALVVGAFLVLSPSLYNDTESGCSTLILVQANNRDAMEEAVLKLEYAHLLMGAGESQQASTSLAPLDKGRSPAAQFTVARGSALLHYGSWWKVADAGRLSATGLISKSVTLQVLRPSQGIVLILCSCILKTHC